MTNPGGERAGTAELPHRLAETVRQALRAGDAPGCAVALTVDGCLMFAAGIGGEDLAGATPLSSEAQCYVYSVTKPLLAIAALQLVKQGHLALDTAVQTYLPSLPLATPVTVRQLLNHTGGIPDYGSMPAYTAALRATPTLPWTSEEFLARTLTHGLIFPPGQGWAYSNIGYLIIRLLIEQIFGTSLRAALQRNLFAPLGLQRTFVAQTLEDASVLTPGYSAFLHAGGELADIRPLYHPGWVSHGVVIASATELAHLFDALFAGALLTPEQLAAMLAPTLVPHTHAWFRQPAYGLGVMLDAQSPYGMTAGHGGGGPGYSVAVLHCAEVGGHAVTSVAMVNRDQPDLGMRIACALVDEFAVLSAD
jgi:D-alanyl-D-alanine carboxypeptidase